MRRFICLIGAIGLSASSIVACSDDDFIVGPGRAGAGGSGGSAGRGGSGGSGGAAGSSAGSNAGGTGGGSAAGAAGVAGTAGSAGEAGSGSVDSDAGGDAGADEPDSGGPAPVVDAGDAGLVIPCTTNPDCDDSNDCTTEVCTSQVCVFTPVLIGTACGDTSTVDECTQADTCDGAGVCLTNNQPDGTLCADGHCNTEGACDCAVERITAVPYGQQWQTTGANEIDVVFPTGCQQCDNSPDHIVVFTAPQTASYRFSATSGGFPEVAVYESDCTGDLSGGTFECAVAIGESASELDLEIEAGATVSVVVAENCISEGGTGFLAIDLTPDDG